MMPLVILVLEIAGVGVRSACADGGRPRVGCGARVPRRSAPGT